MRDGWDAKAGEDFISISELGSATRLSTFQGYTASARRVIFFAREAALHAGSSHIDSTHILSGLLVEQSTRVNKIFQLSERFPEETSHMRALGRFPQPRDISLSKDGKGGCGGSCSGSEPSQRLLDRYRSPHVGNLVHGIVSRCGEVEQGRISSQRGSRHCIQDCCLAR